MTECRRRQKPSRDQAIYPLALLLTALSVSCSSPSPKPPVTTTVAPAEINFDSFSRIPFGTPAQEIVSRFGPPQKAFKLSDKSELIFIYQNEPNQPWRTSFGFDPQKKTLTGKRYEPRSEEKVSSFEKLKAQFKDAEFYRPPVSMCGSHYAMNKGLIFVLGTGVQLTVDPHTQELSSISFGPVQPKPRSPAQLPDGCPKGPVVMGEEVENPLSLLSTN